MGGKVKGGPPPGDQTPEYGIPTGMHSCIKKIITITVDSNFALTTKMSVQYVETNKIMLPDNTGAVLQAEDSVSGHWRGR